jgi:hypothetical protein
MERSVRQEAQHRAGLEAEVAVPDVLRVVQLVARERDLGVAELDLHDHIVSHGRLVGTRRYSVSKTIPLICTKSASRIAFRQR